MRTMLTILALLVMTVTTWAQTPQQQPLVQAGDVKYLGFFTLPTSGPDAIAVDGTTLYAGYSTCVQTLALPALGGMATPLSGCSFLPNIDQVHPTDRQIRVGGILPYAGSVVTDAWVYYDGSGGATRSHWKGTNIGALMGPYTVSTDALGQLRPAFVAGGMGTVPPEWRTLFGGPALTGNCCQPIISRASYGPSVSVFDPAHIDGRPSVPSTMLLGFPVEHRNLGPWEGRNTYYGGTDQLGGIGFPAGTRSILFTGRHGDSWCYGPATADKALVGTVYGGDPLPRCYDPTDFNRGNHGPDYRPMMWAVDANDALAVKQGTKKPWDIQPYAIWTLPGMPIAGVQNLMRAGYYDPATKRFYVASGDSPKVYVYEITIGGGGGGGPVDVNCAESNGPWGPDYTTSEGWSACEIDGGVSKKWRSRTWTTTTAKSGNGAACVWTGSGPVGATFEQFEHVACEPPPPIDKDCVPGTERKVSEIAGACVAGKQTFTETWTRDGDVPAVGNGKACVPVVTPRFRTGECEAQPPALTITATGTTQTCALAVTANKPPDTTAGWGVQFSRRLEGSASWLSHGTRDTAAPYTRSANVGIGTWETRAVWSRTGAASVQVPAFAVWSCKR